MVEPRNHLHQTQKQSLELADNVKLMQKLDYYYRLVNTVILSKQHPSTGLMPASTAVSKHGDYRDAWVRDNVYSILAVFGLCLAYRRCDDDKGRTYELEHAVVKLMRGLLFAMMRQCEKVELFKNKQLVTNALHAKYSTSTGDTVVGDLEWGHLQLDATSIFILALAQMTAAGLQIIFTSDEVDFVQNLVFYIERAYRTPDYGIWERGNKINHGQPELNSSSIGMAVAALQAINGINLFGMRGGSSSVIHVLPDEITRNYTTLCSMLPRESYSKEIDAALFSVIGFPAFAVHDLDLVKRTKEDIIKKLGGKYGCKRFLRDGHQTVLEDNNRLHYDAHELQMFEHIECEWPLFFTYIVLEGVFSGNYAQVLEYREALQKCIVFTEPEAPVIRVSSSHLKVERKLSSVLRNELSKLPKEPFPLIPELYYVEKENVEAEKKDPSSQKRTPNHNVPLVWAESLYVLGELLYEGLLSPAEIDPLGRYLLPSTRGNLRKDTVIQIVLISEDTSLQSKLSTYGLETQTLEQVSPITISSPIDLRNAYTALGANEKMGLTGRPKRPIGTLGTCKLYRIQGRLYAFTPHFMDKQEFYMTNDNDYLVSVFEHELLFTRNHWWYSGRPTMVIYLTHNMLGSSISGSKSSTVITDAHQIQPKTKVTGKSFALPSKQRKSLLSFFMSLRSGSCAGIRVKLARMQEVVPTSCIESLEFVVNKFEQGYFASRFKSWQDLLGGLNLRKKFESKLHPCESLSPTDTHRFALQRRASALSSPSATSPSQPTITATPPASAESYYEEPIPQKKAFDFKLKGFGHGAEIVDGRPSSPLLFAKKSSVFDLDTEPLRAKSPNEAKDIKCMYITLGDSTYLDASIDYLNTSTNINDQVDLLHYIYSCRGLDFSVHLDSGNATVKELLEEIYLKASDARLWSVLRQVAGILRKVVNSLTINLTDLLVRQKQVTLGFGAKEYPISTPLGPDVLADIIYTNSRDDSREPPLIQEILTYLGSFVRSEPHLLDGILRVRVHYILLAMREEISRLTGCSEIVAFEHIMKMSPSEMKSLLGFILSAKDYAKQFCSKVSNKGVKLATILVTVQSAGYHDGNFANIEINDCKHLSGGERGLNVVIVNPDDGSVIDSCRFDTHISEGESNEFAKTIESYEPGVIFVICAKDDAFENLNEAAKIACEELGSRLVRNCKIRDSWCIIGRKNSPSFIPVESMQSSHNGPSEKISMRFNFGSVANSTLDVISAEFLSNKGALLRRRKIDGALQRAPLDFYPKVHAILSKCSMGLKINDHILPRDPTISEKTPEEINFALQVEWLLNAIRDPAERQIAVECLVAMSDIEKSKPELHFGTGGLVDIMRILHESYEIFWNSWIVKEGYKKFQNIINGNEFQLPQYNPNLKTSEEILAYYGYNNNKRLAYRLFIDLSQEDTGGTMDFLTRAILKQN